jgi:hypothetical protein
MSVTGRVGYHPNHFSNVSTYKLGTNTSRRLQQVFDDTTGFEANYINCHASGTLYTVLNAVKDNTNNIEVDTTAMLSSLGDIRDNTTLTASRTLLVKDALNELTDGSGDTAGQLLKAIETDIESWTSRSHTISGTQANLMNAQGCVAAGTTSSVVDWFSSVAVPKRVTIIVTASASVVNTGFEVWVSADNTTWGRLTVGTSATITMSTTNSAGGTIDTTGGCVIDGYSMRYLKIIVYSLGTYTATAIGLS